MINGKWRGAEERWVEFRAACTMHGTFDQIADAINCNIDHIDRLPETKSVGRLFKRTKPEFTARFVGQIERNDHWASPLNDATRKAGATAISVFRNEQCMFEIEHAYNSEGAPNCDLKFDGKSHSIWQTSQKTIGDPPFGL